MTVDVSLAPALFSPERGAGKSVAVIDVLRASTTLITALGNGAECAIPFASPEAARAFFATCTHGNALLCGERGGQRIGGFDLGNSPAEYVKEKVQGKTLLFASTNGSRMLVSAEGAAEVLVAGFLNAAACAGRLARGREGVLLLCAGWEGAVSLEDAVCAGLVIHEMRKASSVPLGLEDAAAAAETLYRAHHKDIPGMLMQSSHGKRLSGLGFGSDLPLCGRVNVTRHVPVCRGGRIVLDAGPDPAPSKT